MAEATFWNGEPCEARKVTVIVGDSGRFPKYWARGFVGSERAAVEVRYFDEPFYLDDEDGSGWFKVTTGHGSPRYRHRDIEVERIVSPVPSPASADASLDTKGDGDGSR